MSISELYAPVYAAACCRNLCLYWTWYISVTKFSRVRQEGSGCPVRLKLTGSDAVRLMEMCKRAFRQQSVGPKGHFLSHCGLWQYCHSAGLSSMALFKQKVLFSKALKQTKWRDVHIYFAAQAILNWTHRFLTVVCNNWFSAWYAFPLLIYFI